MFFTLFEIKNIFEKSRYKLKPFSLAPYTKRLFDLFNRNIILTYPREMLPT